MVTATADRALTTDNFVTERHFANDQNCRGLPPKPAAAEVTEEKLTCS